jgi:hypothetical protein
MGNNDPSDQGMGTAKSKCLLKPMRVISMIPKRAATFFKANRILCEQIVITGMSHLFSLIACFRFEARPARESFAVFEKMLFK